MFASMRFILFFVSAIGFMGGASTEKSQAVQHMNPSPNPPVNADNPKALIVYLSRTKNTEALAKMVQEQVGGDLVALALQTPYPKNYQAIVRQVDQDGYLPPLKT
ncbi:hypothetical protein [Acinetobacter puyangensis]|uniref:hypothetical protein n=1 Tax=Acinetobacter puyangensis TaxID=1096779 RepID=UPI003A4E471D